MESKANDDMPLLRLEQELDQLDRRLQNAVEKMVTTDKYRRTADYQDNEEFVTSGRRCKSAFEALQKCFDHQLVDKSKVVKVLKFTDYMKELEAVNKLLPLSEAIPWKELHKHTDKLNKCATDMAHHIGKIRDTKFAPVAMNSDPGNVADADTFVFWFLKFGDDWKKKRNLESEVWHHLVEELYKFGFELKPPVRTDESIKVCETFTAKLYNVYNAFRSVLEPWADDTPVKDFFQTHYWSSAIRKDPKKAESVTNQIDALIKLSKDDNVKTVKHLREYKQRKSDGIRRLSNTLLKLSKSVPDKVESITFDQFRKFVRRFGPFRKLVIKFCALCVSTDGRLVDHYIPSEAESRVASFLHYHKDINYAVRPSGSKLGAFTRQTAGLKHLIHNRPNGYETEPPEPKPSLTLASVIDSVWLRKSGKHHQYFNGWFHHWQDTVFTLERGGYEEYCRISQEYEANIGMPTDLEADLVAVNESLRDLHRGQSRLAEGQGHIVKGQGRLVDGQGNIRKGQGRLVDGQGNIRKGQGHILKRQGDILDGQAEIKKKIDCNQELILRLCAFTARPSMFVLLPSDAGDGDGGAGASKANKKWFQKIHKAVKEKVTTPWRIHVICEGGRFDQNKNLTACHFTEKSYEVRLAKTAVVRMAPYIKASLWLASAVASMGCFGVEVGLDIVTSKILGLVKDNTDFLEGFTDALDDIQMEVCAAPQGAFAQKLRGAPPPHREGNLTKEIIASEAFMDNSQFLHDLLSTLDESKDLVQGIQQADLSFMYSEKHGMYTWVCDKCREICSNDLRAPAAGGSVNKHVVASSPPIGNLEALSTEIKQDIYMTLPDSSAVEESPLYAKLPDPVEESPLYTKLSYSTEDTRGWNSPASSQDMRGFKSHDAFHGMRGRNSQTTFHGMRGRNSRAPLQNMRGRNSRAQEMRDWDSPASFQSMGSRDSPTSFHNTGGWGSPTTFQNTSGRNSQAPSRDTSGRNSPAQVQAASGMIGRSASPLESPPASSPLRSSRLRPSKCKGTTVLKIVKAKGLANVEFSKSDISDPLVKFWFGELQMDLPKNKTKHMNNTLEPIWNLHHNEYAEFRDIHLEVWDHNQIRSNVFMGATCIREPMLKVVKRGHWSFKGWRTLGSTSRRRNGKLIDSSNAQGQLFVEVDFHADEIDDEE